MKGMDEGNGFRPVNRKGCPVAAAPQPGGLCSWPLWNKLKFRPSVPFQPACGSRLVVCGDALRGFRLLLTRDRRAARAVLKKLKILN